MEIIKEPTPQNGMATGKEFRKELLRRYSQKSFAEKIAVWYLVAEKGLSWKDLGRPTGSEVHVLAGELVESGSMSPSLSELVTIKSPASDSGVKHLLESALTEIGVSTTFSEAKAEMIRAAMRYGKDLSKAVLAGELEPDSLLECIIQSVVSCLDQEEYKLFSKGKSSVFGESESIIREFVNIADVYEHLSSSARAKADQTIKVLCQTLVNLKEGSG